MKTKSDLQAELRELQGTIEGAPDEAEARFISKKCGELRRQIRGLWQAETALNRKLEGAPAQFIGKGRKLASQGPRIPRADTRFKV